MSAGSGGPPAKGASGGPDTPPGPKDRVKEACRLIRLARSKWEAHNNLGCRTERDRALALYDTMTKEEKDAIPRELRVWLRYRSEKYFGPGRTAPGGDGRRGTRREAP